MRILGAWRRSWRQACYSIRRRVSCRPPSRTRGRPWHIGIFSIHSGQLAGHGRHRRFLRSGSRNSATNRRDRPSPISLRRGLAATTRAPAVAAKNTRSAAANERHPRPLAVRKAGFECFAPYRSLSSLSFSFVRDASGRERLRERGTRTIFGIEQRPMCAFARRKRDPPLTTPCVTPMCHA